MEPSKPNSFAQALAAQKAAGEHPDADVLTAFAEGSLLARERETVMAHLAACAECREVVSLSATEQARELELIAAASPVAARPAVVAALAGRPTRMKGSAWLPLAAAACLAFATAVAVYYGHKKTEQMAIVHEQTAVPAQAAPETSKTGAVNEPPAAPAPGAAMEQAQHEVKQSLKANANDKVSLASASEKKAPAGRAESRGLAAASKPAVAPERTQDALVVTNQAVVQNEQQIAAEASREASVRKDEQPAQSASMQAQPSTAAAPAQAPAFHGAFAKNAQAGMVARPRWRINDQGYVERTFGSGAWERVLTSESSRMRVVSVVAGTVWAGGENDLLYRSEDQGATWQKVGLPEKNGSQHAIVHIRFENAMTGTIEAEDGTSWATTDGGATWK